MAWSEVKEIIPVIINGALTGSAMMCMYNLEMQALAMGINGTQFTYVIAGIALLGGVTMAPILDYFKKKVVAPVG